MNKQKEMDFRVLRALEAHCKMLPPLSAPPLYFIPERLGRKQGAR